MHGRVRGGREGQFWYFQIFIAFLLIIDIGFGSNLNAFMGQILLNKRVHETLKHNSPRHLL